MVERINRKRLDKSKALKFWYWFRKFTFKKRMGENNWKGRKQIYGSQIGTNPNDKTLYVLPLIDPDNVDKRRTAVGLGSISDYIKNWNYLKLEWTYSNYGKFYQWEYESMENEF